MFETGVEQARALDAADPLGHLRERFVFPTPQASDEVTYFVGNSLGLQPRAGASILAEELEKWATRGVRGHFESEVRTKEAVIAFPVADIGIVAVAASVSLIATGIADVAAANVKMRVAEHRVDARPPP